jgi:hypothetical protein
MAEATINSMSVRPRAEGIRDPGFGIREEGTGPREEGTESLFAFWARNPKPESRIPNFMIFVLSFI